MHLHVFYLHLYFIISTIFTIWIFLFESHISILFLSLSRMDILRWSINLIDARFIRD